MPVALTNPPILHVLTRGLHHPDGSDLPGEVFGFIMPVWRPSCIATRGQGASRRSSGATPYGTEAAGPIILLAERAGVSLVNGAPLTGKHNRKWRIVTNHLSLRHSLRSAPLGTREWIPGSG